MSISLACCIKIFSTVGALCSFGAAKTNIETVKRMERSLALSSAMDQKVHILPGSDDLVAFHFDPQRCRGTKVMVTETRC